MHFPYMSISLSILSTCFTATALSERNSILVRRAIVEDAYTAGYTDALKRRSLERRLDGKDPGKGLLHKILYTPFPEFMQKGNQNPTYAPSVQSGDPRLNPKPHGFKETLVPGTKNTNPQILRDQNGGFLGKDEHSGDSRKEGTGSWMAPSKQQIDKNVGKLFDNMPSRETSSNRNRASLKAIAGSIKGLRGAASAKQRRSLYEEDEFDFDF